MELLKIRSVVKNGLNGRVKELLDLWTPYFQLEKVQSARPHSPALGGIPAPLKAVGQLDGSIDRSNAMSSYRNGIAR